MSQTRVTGILDELRHAGDPERAPIERPRVIDERTCGLVSIGAAASIGAALPTYVHLVRQATAAGATPAECIGAVLAVASEAGEARIVTAAPRISAALGYDLDRALEE